MGRHNLSNLIKEAAENLNKPLSNKEIKLVILKLPLKGNLSAIGFSDEFYQTFKEEVTPILHKLFQNTEKVGIFFNSFFEVFP